MQLAKTSKLGSDRLTPNMVRGQTDMLDQNMLLHIKKKSVKEASN